MKNETLNRLIADLEWQHDNELKELDAAQKKFARLDSSTREREIILKILKESVDALPTV
jgi:hypothetical protein